VCHVLLWNLQSQRMQRTCDSCTDCGIACCHTETKNLNQVMYVKYCSSAYNSFDDYDKDEVVLLHIISGVLGALLN
jgi:hypothetical protein